MYRFTRREAKLLALAIDGANTGQWYVISGYLVRVAAVRLLDAGAIRLHPVPDRGGKRGPCHAVEPTDIGRYLLLRQQTDPYWRSRGGDTRSAHFRSSRQALVTRALQLGRQPRHRD